VGDDFGEEIAGIRHEMHAHRLRQRQGLNLEPLTLVESRRVAHPLTEEHLPL
jgi:hypothetical protein